MTRTDYINFSLKKLFELFPNLPNILYSFDELSDTDFICIPDKLIFETDDFVRFSAETSLSYYESGFNGTLAFISNIDGMDYLQFHQMKNTYLVKQDLMNNIFLNPSVKDFLMHPVIQSFADSGNSIFNMPNQVYDSLNTFNDYYENKFLFTPVSANDFWEINPNLTGSSIFFNTESFIVLPEEEIIIALAA